MKKPVNVGQVSELTSIGQVKELTYGARLVRTRTLRVTDATAQTCGAFEFYA